MSDPATEEPLADENDVDAESAETLAGRPPWLSLALAGVLLIGLAYVRWSKGDYDRPLEVDEMISIRYYTWVGTDEWGESRPLPTVESFRSTPRPSPRQYLIGLYCSMGRWPEPNNHIVQSALLGLSLAVGGCSERAARAPALWGAVAAAAAAFYLIAVELRWRLAGWFVLLWLWFSPFVVIYSQTARGYTWMLALQFAGLIAAKRFARSPGSVNWAIAGVVVAVATTLNLINLGIDWVAPLWLAQWWVSGAEPSSAASRRKGLVVQGLAIGAILAMFAIAHLPMIYSSAQQYGVKFASFDAMVAGAWNVVAMQLPDIDWMLWGLLGLVGLTLLAVSRQHQFLPVFAIAFIVANATHVLVTSTLPYPRTAGYFLPILLIGGGYVVDRSLALGRAWLERGAMVMGFAALTGLLVYSGSSKGVVEPLLARRIATAGKVPGNGAPTMVVVNEGLDFVFSLYAPAGWKVTDALEPEPLRPRQKLNIVAFRRESRDLAADEMARFVGTTHDLSDNVAIQQGSLVFWYPDVTRIGVNDERAIRFVAETKIPHQHLHGRYALKMVVFSSLRAFVFPVDTERSYRGALDIIQEGMRRFGGEATLFLAREGKRRPVTD